MASDLSYFLKLEKSHQTYNKIDQLKTDDEITINKDADILQECTKFYKNLYKSSKPDPAEIDKYLNDTEFPNRLSNDNKDICEGLITSKECEKAIKSLKNNKSPGLDGLTPEFYKTFWPTINKTVIDCFNESFEQGQLSDTQKKKERKKKIQEV